eukprot:m.228163 g.228163  ORF g.228163 m.228163 type:complete len:126 (+) comp18827_c0_seq1:3029-3406(+)
MLRSACQLREQLAQAQLDSELRPQYERLIERIQAQLEDSVPKAQHEAIANDLAAMQETERERRVLDRLFEEQTETLGRLKGDYDSACQAVGESCTSVSRECLARLLLLQCRGYTGVQGQLLRPNT